MTNINNRPVRCHAIRYHVGTQGWTRLAMPGQLDEVLAQLFREEPRAELRCIDTTYRA